MISPIISICRAPNLISISNGLIIAEQLTDYFEMTPEQICALLSDDLLQFLPQQGQLLAERREDDAQIFLFLYCETLIEVFFVPDSGELMGSSYLESRERLEAYKNHLSDARLLQLNLL